MTNAPTSAVISPCGRYRYRLGRQLPPREGACGTCLFIMLNPSTADDDRDDQTIRKCMTYAAGWGYARLEVVNLFAWRATNPLELAPLTIANASGQDNDKHIRAALAESACVVGAWGNGKGARVLQMVAERRRDVRTLIDNAGAKLHRLSLTKAGNPSHPLYLRGDLRPEPNYEVQP